MTKRAFYVGILAAVGFATIAGQAQAPNQGAAQGRGAGRGAAAQGGGGRGAAAPAMRRTTEVGGRLAPADQKYAAIDEKKLMADVEAQAAISRRYRDNGNPQYWGRIIGSEADAENAKWIMDRFKTLGLSDIKMQTIDLAPQWWAKSWTVSASGGGKTVQVNTAQPTYTAVGTPAAGLDLEAVWVGLGSDADIALSRDVKGKAAVFYSTDLSSRHQGISDNAIRRLQEKGAAAIFVVLGIPGNLRTQFYPVGANVPTFTTGQQDGLALRDLIASTVNGTPARIKLNLQVEQRPGLKSGTVWGTLPGTTDETIFIVAHRDGWFEGANDNAAGVASMLAMAEYFSKIPAAQRKRTIHFLGTTGHHNSGPNSGALLAANQPLFAKAALLVNCEHTGQIQTSHTAPRGGNSPGLASWHAGSPKVAELLSKALDAFGVGTYPTLSGSAAGEISRYQTYAPSLQVMTSGYVWHSDGETPEQISATGLAAITRAYAKVAEDVNAFELKDLRTAAMDAPRPPAAAR